MIQDLVAANLVDLKMARNSIREPMEPEIRKLVEGDWMEFYGSFRDANGKSLFEHFAPVLWDRRGEPKDAAD